MLVKIFSLDINFTKFTFIIHQNVWFSQTSSTTTNEHCMHFQLLLNTLQMVIQNWILNTQILWTFKNSFFFVTRRCQQNSSGNKKHTLTVFKKPQGIKHGLCVTVAILNIINVFHSYVFWPKYNGHILVKKTRTTH